MPAESGLRATVVFVHGIWMTGLELGLLRRRVADCGYQTRLFRYASLRRSPHENAQTLADFLDTLHAEQLHLVAHSLGGIVICHLLAQVQPVGLGRILMLGSPLRGSEVARQVWRHPWARWLLGRACEEGLLGDAPCCPAGRAIGMIAGNRGFGIGNLIAGRKLPRPHDGTVALRETQDPSITDRLVVPYSHLSMLFARPVAQMVCRYLDVGRFTQDLNS